MDLSVVSMWTYKWCWCFMGCYKLPKKARTDHVNLPKTFVLTERILEELASSGDTLFQKALNLLIVYKSLISHGFWGYAPKRNNKRTNHVQIKSRIS